MKCDVCNAEGVTKSTRDLPHVYKGQRTTIQNVEGFGCAECGEFILGADEAQRVSTEMLKFNQHVNEGDGRGAYIAAVREKLGLDRKAAGQVFGGGVNAFSRYELGKTEPAPSLMLLLRLLDNHPNLLPEIQQMASSAHLASRRRDSRRTA
ncbi:type II toxin-antitoxin system MqsA family antitoxin [Asticcacaulis sp. SL142]|uniref:type II TA system antitoxin MqsA family protein n=1 Tax=Asticcacaulis sp. SL142 TaxID=2995155 RepID=UPI00226D1E9D|nr:type II TA system antitoxin MqsA family protein [Asticcacaulis sp. SL142]WAC49404.1 type II toxin-antitoxin system MqsA family antitoxin [Asticcacaulis sp. SL142]